MRFGRIVFGASAVLSGVVGFMWHDSDIWQHVHPLWAPLATIIAWCFAIAQVAGGIGLLSALTARLASIVLSIVYALLSLANLPDMFVTPANAVLYVDFFEQFSLVCGATAAYAATGTQAASLGRAARVGLGVCALSFAWAQVVYLQYTASLVPTWIPPSQMFWTILTTIAFLLAAVAMLINVQARLAMRLMALMIALFGMLVWVPHIIAQPGQLSNWNEIAANYLMAGAAMLVADLRSF